MHPLKGKKQSPEHIAKRVAAIRASGRYGRPNSPEHNAKISAALKGRRPAGTDAMLAAAHTPEVYAKIAATKLKSDDVGYGQAHERVRLARGWASEHDCEFCGSEANQWALDHEAPAEHLRYRYDGLPYSVRVSDYMSLCHSCHVTYDLR